MSKIPQSLFAGFLLLLGCGGRPASPARGPDPRAPITGAVPDAGASDAAAAHSRPATQGAGSNAEAPRPDAAVNIAGTTIPDTPANQGVLAAIEAYRHAMERYDVQALVAMVHPDYWDGRGGSNIDRDRQVETIRSLAGRVSAIKLRIEYRHIDWLSADAVDVEVEIHSSYTLGTVTKQVLDTVRIELREHDGNWLFASGM